MLLSAEPLPTALVLERDCGDHRVAVWTRSHVRVLRAHRRRAQVRQGDRKSRVVDDQEEPLILFQLSEQRLTQLTC